MDGHIREVLTAKMKALFSSQIRLLLPGSDPVVSASPSALRNPTCSKELRLTLSLTSGRHAAWTQSRGLSRATTDLRGMLPTSPCQQNLAALLCFQTLLNSLVQSLGFFCKLRISLRHPSARREPFSLSFSFLFLSSYGVVHISSVWRWPELLLGPSPPPLQVVFLPFLATSRSDLTVSHQSLFSEWMKARKGGQSAFNTCHSLVTRVSALLLFGSPLKAAWLFGQDDLPPVGNNC